MTEETNKEKSRILKTQKIYFEWYMRDVKFWFNITYLDINIDKINKKSKIIKIKKTAALDKSLIFFISVSNSLVILSDNFSIDVFNNSNANNKK